MARRRTIVLVAVLSAAAALAVSAIGVLPAGAGDAVAHTVPEMRRLRGVWCRPDRTCLGVGEVSGRGGVVRLGPTGVLGPVQSVRGTRSLEAIACLPDGDCIAVGERGRSGAVVVRLAAGGTPLAVRPVLGANALYGVACPTSTTCLATGSQWTDLADPPSVPVFVVLTNGEPAPAQRFPRGPRRFIGIACPTATTCLAVGGGPVAVFTGAGGSWSVTYAPRGTATPGDAVSCPSPSTCHTIAVGRVQTPEGYLSVPAILALTADGLPGEERIVSEHSGVLYGISCVAEWTCTLVGRDHEASRAQAIDVTPSGPPVVDLWDNTNYFFDASCTSATECGIVGAGSGLGQPPVFAWTG